MFATDRAVRFAIAIYILDIKRLSWDIDPFAPGLGYSQFHILRAVKLSQSAVALGLTRSFVVFAVHTAIVSVLRN